MKKNYGINALLVVGVLSASVSTVQAQKEYSNWYFGNQAALSFSSGTPQAVTNSSMITYEGCSSISNSSGQLLMYTNGENVWDANHQVMPNGGFLGSQNSASQGALILKMPGNNSLYYIFTVDAIDNNLVGGLRYSIVDMNQRGGLGDVVTKGIRLPTPNVTDKVTEKLTAAVHANGRDYWVVVHGWQNNNFYSFLLSSNGVSTTPVNSSVGPVHQGGGSFFGAANAVGYMRISPNGAKLALAQRDTQFELYNFDNSSGIVSNYINLRGTNTYHYGIEFSPNSSILYTTMYSDGGFSSEVYQFNITANTPSAIQNSAQIVGSVSGLSGAIQAAGNGKIYISSHNKSSIHSIEKPNVIGAGCIFQQNSVSLSGKLAQIGLPNQPNATASIVTSSQKLIYNSALSFYPNPASDKLYISLPVEMRKYENEIAVYNSIGELVIKYKIASGVEQKILSIAELKKGVYSIRLQNQVQKRGGLLVVQ